MLGVGVHATTMPGAVGTIARWVAAREARYVCVSGVHGVMESQRDAALRGIHNAAGLVTMDGMPLVWLGRLAGHADADRVYGPDLMLAVCAALAPHGGRHFFYGATDDVLARLTRRLRERVPGLVVAGTYAPPFRPLTPEEDADVVARINAADPHVVWVGLSTPKQERWMAAHVGRVRGAVLIGVGAAFDFHAGVKPQAPRWMQRAGLEWLFRLACEPRRLGPRYLVNNPRFVWSIVRQALGDRRYGPLRDSECRS